jgi:hypothetical protein
MTSHYLWAALHYTCDEGHHNSVNKFFVCPTSQLTASDLSPYLPRQWRCVLCGRVSPAPLDISLYWLTPSQWAGLRDDERSSAIMVSSGLGG